MVILGAGLIPNDISLSQISFWEPAFVNVASLPKVPTSSALDEIERAPFPVLSPSHRRVKIYLCWSSVGDLHADYVWTKFLVKEFHGKQFSKLLVGLCHFFLLLGCQESLSAWSGMVRVLGTWVSSLLYLKFVVLNELQRN